MTNKEAASEIQKRVKTMTYVDEQCFANALWMAIEALESMQELEKSREKQKKCECKDLKEALIRMVGQFAYEGKSECGQKIYQTGVLSALELAFETLGIEENSIYSELWSLMEDSNE